jgi:transcriptional regulator with XRE-family HTH domain|nr:MAG TPA: Helix-turn-helix XRE-family like protein [Caudoviricetes sp.]
MIESGIDIGLIIEQKLNELGISKSELARRTGIANQNVNRILSKSSIDTDKLVAISKALGYNFFLEFVDSNHSAIANGDGSIAVNGNNNKNVVAGGESTALLQERIKHLEELLAEKERLIKVLLEGREK